MTSNKNIVIIGSGWLSWPLAQHLTGLGHHVIATSTDQEKAQRLTNSSIQVIQLITSNLERSDIIKTLKDCQIMIIAIPPKRQQTDYFNQLQQLLNLAEKLQITNILFISSSSVYGDQLGTVTELSATQADTSSALAMTQFEQLLLTDNHSVLRLSGLIDSQRHPGRFLAGKTAVANPDAVVNMIHLADCIGLIAAIIKQDAWGKVLLGSSPSHPTRRQFYHQAALALELEPPQFVAHGGDDSKLIDGQQTAASLNYRYQYPDLIQWLTTA